MSAFLLVGVMLFLGPDAWIAQLSANAATLGAAFVAIQSQVCAEPQNSFLSIESFENSESALPLQLGVVSESLGVARYPLFRWEKFKKQTTPRCKRSWKMPRPASRRTRKRRSRSGKSRRSAEASGKQPCSAAKASSWHFKC